MDGIAGDSETRYTDQKWLQALAASGITHNDRYLTFITSAVDEKVLDQDRPLASDKGLQEKMVV